MPVAPSVVAVVPTFAPPESTFDLLRCLVSQVADVVVSDDASPCTSDALLQQWRNLTGLQVVRHRHNRGIARGLNEGLGLAQESQAAWLLTVDQDTQLADNYVERIVSSATGRLEAGELLGAIGAEVINETSGGMRYPIRESLHGSITEEVIQTGTLWNVAALTAIGGFDEDLRIDAVDAAACLALRGQGFTVGVETGLGLQHTIGQSRTIRIAGRPVMITGHSPQRRASMLRNRLRLFPAEFRQSPGHAVRTIRRVAVNQGLGLVVESGRWGKLKGSIRGLSGQSKDNLQP